jgi:RecJ-like exonuclease
MKEQTTTRLLLEEREDEQFKYTGPDHPDAFVDYPLAPKPHYEGMFTDEPCPRCKGHGGWNLQVNAYSLHGKEDTPENRHLFAHFRAMCGSCNGWGYMRVGQTCAHEWGSPRTVGRCLTEWTCVHCGEKTQVDSSD